MNVAVKGRPGRRRERVRRSPVTPRAARPSTPTANNTGLVRVALLPSIGVLIVVATLVVVSLLVSNSDLTGTYGAIALGWLAVHQVPVTIGHATLGILPLLPTGLLMWVVARECSRATAEPARVVAAAVAGPMLLALIALMVVEDAAEVGTVTPPAALSMLVWVVGVHFVAALVGVTYAHREQIVVDGQLPEWAIAAARPIEAALRRILGAATVVTVGSLVWHASTIGSLMTTNDGAVGVLGLSLVSLAYLPNVVAGATALMFGTGAHIGTASVGMFAVVSGPLPPVPVLAAVPSAPAAPWWPILLLVPMYVAVVLGRECALRCLDRGTAVAATLVAATAVTATLTMLIAAAGGELGAYGHLDVGLTLFALATGGWLAVFGCVAASFAPLGRAVRRSPEPEPPREFTDNTVIEVDAELVTVLTPPALAVGPEEVILEAEIVEDKPGS